MQKRGRALCKRASLLLYIGYVCTSTQQSCRGHSEGQVYFSTSGEIGVSMLLQQHLTRLISIYG